MKLGGYKNKQLTRQQILTERFKWLSVVVDESELF
jgi:hypothetical protein